jgi:hypothetical protein
LITCIVNIFFKCVEDEADNSEELIATDYNLELIEPFFFFLVLVNNVSQTIEINRVEVFSYLPPPPPPPPPPPRFSSRHLLLLVYQGQFGMAK